ncbi:MAG: terpene cyclase/mutase family protein [Pirellulaceae bacterium]|jgi:geranylgeranyl transferase type-2 subunit beta|nr:terpene cyclase/mutase family protein [Pirellulaceae bacterium]
MAYLEDLTLRLAQGIAELPEATRQRHSRYLLAAQRPDGGFAGREGGSDLYYTGFALRGLALLGDLYGPVAERAAGFLRARLGGEESIVDFFSLVYGAALLDTSAGIDVFHAAGPTWRDNVARLVESFRRDDGGYAKGAGGMASSTYHTFLVLLSLELAGRSPPDPERIVAFLLSQRADEGGFREIRASKRAGTNPTAAAIASLQMLGALDDESREGTIDFLAEMQTDEGGLRANTRIPIADLLSSFTGLLTLQDLGGAAEIDLTHLRQYVSSLERPEGGFHGAAWDGAHDVEYSFYGLGCLGLLAVVN